MPDELPGNRHRQTPKPDDDGETVRTFTVPNASRFIRSGNGRIQLEVRQFVFFPFTLGGFQTYFDQIEIHAR